MINTQLAVLLDLVLSVAAAHEESAICSGLFDGDLRPGRFGASLLGVPLGATGVGHASHHPPDVDRR